MKNSFGQSLTLTLFGESHGTGIGAVLDGLAPGLPVEEETIVAMLARRRPTAQDTPRREADCFRILSGVFAGKTTGTPLCLFIPNENTHSNDYDYGKARPSHADYAAFCKYHGFEDYRGGGHFSGRITAALVAAGGILLPTLSALNITVGTHIRRLADIEDAAFGEDVAADVHRLALATFPVLDENVWAAMNERTEKAKSELDSLGGITETAVCGLPAGLGEPWFDSAEGLLSHALFSIGGIKGVEFGTGFSLSAMQGSEANDPFCLQGGRIGTRTNHSGGINGGITNGMPLLFRCAVKPTPSIAREQETVDFLQNEEISYTIRGRHDPAIVRRIPPVIDSICALVLCDMIAMRFGTDALREGFSCGTD